MECDIAMSGLRDLAKVVDDILCGNPTFEEHLKRVVEVLIRSQEHGITMSPEKFIFGQPEVSSLATLLEGKVSKLIRKRSEQ